MTSSADWLASVVSEKGFGLGLIATFVAGLLLNLTPCVYPMIPVTLAFFNRQALTERRSVAVLAFFYAAGLALSYAVLGAVAAQTGAIFGSWLQSPLVTIWIAVAIVALSLSMFGVYELRVPQVILKRFDSAGSGFWGAFTMGLGVGLVAAPCVGPFLVSLLLVTAKFANPVFGFVFFFILGLGMGLPSIVFALAARRLSALPKSGEWLIWSKKALGVILLGVALWFVHPLLPPALMKWSLQAPQGPSIAWQPYTTAALDAAARNHQPAVVDVYADWCLPCVELDHATFHNPEVIQAFKDIVALRVDVTREASGDAQLLLQKHDIYGVPTVLFFGGGGTERMDLRVTGFVPAEEFLRRLRELKR